MLKPGTEIYIENGEHDSDTGLPVLIRVTIEKLVTSYEVSSNDGSRIYTVDFSDIKGVVE